MNVTTYDTINIHPKITLLSNICDKSKIKLSVLRLDEIHPIISGNKIFKLRYFLEDVKECAHKQIITFGGAYSNHLAATAYACNTGGIRCVGIVRGEEPSVLSSTLLFCRRNKMQLEFISRSAYTEINDAALQNLLREKYGDHILIPEGGFSLRGVKGAEGIMSLFDQKHYSDVCCPIGTATTFAGLVNGADNTTEITGFSVLKNLADIPQRLKKLQVDTSKRYSFTAEYHFGGYAKKTTELIDFLNTFYKDNKIPLDFVYTGKMMFGVYDLIKKNHFPTGSNILCIHTGGLQGNNSLPAGMLYF